MTLRLVTLPIFVLESRSSIRSMIETLEYGNMFTTGRQMKSAK